MKTSLFYGSLNLLSVKGHFGFLPPLISSLDDMINQFFFYTSLINTREKFDDVNNNCNMIK